ncbi:bis(5'-nucleosyl)-tetraphosphatase [Bacillus andreraoultii]|uniref:bis(5'-nucleosyl)-tetraphosphatase n=1 Tax=Bacillus andreraoultii TaxID=1499685 RepID=UPI00053A46D3|nr:NUDIX domain-containing protein [Bacillus andreraoultii]
MKKEKSCGAIVFTEKEPHKVLLVNHENGGHWAFPKGHVEQNETETETALREIYEETGLTVQLDTNFRETITYSPANGITKDVVYFIGFAQTKTVKKQIEEVRDLAWVELEKAIEIVTFENDKAILKAAINYITKRDHRGF